MANKRLRKIAQQGVASLPGFIGNVLARLAEVESVSLDTLLDELGNQDDPTRLLLCRIPRADSFASDVKTIATYAGVDPIRLVNLIRRAEVITAFSSTGERQDGLLLAARENEEEDEQHET